MNRGRLADEPPSLIFSNDLRVVRDFKVINNFRVYNGVIVASGGVIVACRRVLRSRLLSKFAPVAYHDNNQSSAMNIFLRYMCIALLPAALLSCSDDSPSEIPGPGEEETDIFTGDHHSFILGKETAGFDREEFKCRLLAPDGTVITRSGTHAREGDNSHFYLPGGLKEGVYRLLYFEYGSPDGNPAYPNEQFGLGMRIEVTAKGVRTVDSFDTLMQMCGDGSEERPYIITSYTHLRQLKKIVNDRRTNGLITPDTHFRQCGEIDMDYACYSSHKEYGWDPIGNNSNVPFRGHYTGDALPGFWSLRPRSAAVGLFGYLEGATIDSISMPEARINANFAAGAIAGAVISSGTLRKTTTIAHCSVSGGEITGSEQSMAIGGIVGGLDMQAGLSIIGCCNESTTVSATYNAGGIVGASGTFSLMSVNNCSNSGKITTDFSGAGGIIGVADTLYVTGCVNTGTVSGAISYTPADKNNAGIGTGGIVGGTGVSFITASKNYGDIKGYDGTGGIIGSTRVRGSDTEAYVYNNTMLRYCGNNGTVTGNNAVGGVCGEAQFGCFGVYNKGNITGNDYIAGIVGCTSIAVTHNSANSGEINGHSYVAGSVGKTVLGSLAFNQNYGDINSSGTNCAGVVALAGNNTIINHCGNLATVTSTGNGAVGGVVGEIGDPRRWSAMNIAECVVGSLEMVMCVAGPVIAIVAEASHGIGAVLEVGHLLAETILLDTDNALLWLGVNEMLHPEEMEAVETEIHDIITNTGNEVKDELHAIRSGYDSFNSNGFAKEPAAKRYADNIRDNINWLESGENNVESFNKRINTERDKRYEELEELHESQERIHTIVAGVSIVVGIITATAETMVTGGAAVPLIIASSVSAMVGGLNAVTKSVQDYQRNAVIVSGCLNAGQITATEDSDEKVGGVVGILQDNCIFRDNLNIGQGPGYVNLPRGGHFIGRAGSNVELHNSLTIAPMNSWADLVASWDHALLKDHDHIDLQYVYFYSDSYVQNNYILSEPAPLWDHLNTSVKRRSEIGDKTRFSGWSINNGNNARWSIPNEYKNSYPVPARSEMR